MSILNSKLVLAAAARATLLGLFAAQGADAYKINLILPADGRRRLPSVAHVPGTVCHRVSGRSAESLSHFATD
jgi:hypothetical protein